MFCIFTIIDYLKFYKDTSFDDVRWNDLDNLLGAILVYLPVPSFKEGKNLKELYDYALSKTLATSSFMAPKAMEILKNRLYELELKKREEELAKVKGVNSDINFGNQIRTYTMHSYSLVKDHRTNVETNNVTAVMDGDIDMFINAYLKKGVVC